MTTDDEDCAWCMIFLACLLICAIAGLMWIADRVVSWDKRGRRGCGRPKRNFGQLQKYGRSGFGNQPNIIKQRFARQIFRLINQICKRNELGQGGRFVSENIQKSYLVIDYVCHPRESLPAAGRRGSRSGCLIKSGMTYKMDFSPITSRY